MEAPVAPVKAWEATTSVPALVDHYSAVYGVSAAQMLATLTCESSLNPNAIGDYGHSFGVAQIHLPSHPTIAKAQALDPNFAVEWMAEQFSYGKQRMWTCWRNLYL